MVLGLAVAIGSAPTVAVAKSDNGAPQATLMRTHVFEPAPPVFDAQGKPQPSVNCSPDDPTKYGTTPAYTGFTSTVVDRDAHFNASTAPTGVPNATSAIQAAFDVWVTEEPYAPAFSVVTADPVTSATPNRHTDVLFGRVRGNAIAITYTWQWSDTGEYESDTVFNSKVAWAEISTEGVGADGCNEDVVAYDFRNIATHEFGHIYGLGHPAGAQPAGAGDRYATMYTYGYTGETLKRDLAPSDQVGIQTLY